MQCRREQLVRWQAARAQEKDQAAKTRPRQQEKDQAARARPTRRPLQPVNSPRVPAASKPEKCFDLRRGEVDERSVEPRPTGASSVAKSPVSVATTPQADVPSEVQVSSLYAAVIAGEPGSVEIARRFVGDNT